MEKITKKMWFYTTNFLSKSILFNIALVFIIVALVLVNSGLTIWAIIAIALSGVWSLQVIIGHTIWALMSKPERGLWLAIRRHGPKVVELTNKEISARGQKDIHEILEDTDSGLEIQMIINGSGTLINTFIGVKWIINAKKFNNKEGSFIYRNDTNSLNNI